MAFVARKPFTFKGTKYRPGDVVSGFPDDFFRPESFIRTGLIVDNPDAKTPAKRGRKPKAVEPVVEEVVVEESTVEEPSETVFVFSEEHE